jgi:hypothetical protein
MGYGDGFYKKTPNNILLDNSSPLFDNIVDNKVDLYVSTTGDDTNGDGSESNPYATPQRAVDSIPDNLVADTYVEISCGAGTFEFPDTSNLQPRIKVAIIGDTSNPVFSIPVGSIPFNTIAGKYSRRRGNVGTYAESITDGSHWMLIDFSVFDLGKVGYVVQGSTSPDIDIISGTGYDPTSFADSVIYEYSTTFTMSRKNYSSKTSTDDQKQFYSSLVIIGIEITATDNNPYLEGLSFYACKFTTSSTFFNPEMSQCFISAYADSSVLLRLRNENVAIGSYLKRTAIVRGSGAEFRECLFANEIQLYQEAGLFLSEADFEGSGRCILGLYGASAVINNCSVAPTCSSFIDVTYGNCFFTIAGTITGSVTGNAIILKRGSQVTGAVASCNGTLTAGGSEIIVGGNLGQTFASLPASDVGAANPQLCRAD